MPIIVRIVTLRLAKELYNIYIYICIYVYMCIYVYIYIYIYNIYIKSADS